MSGIKNEFDDLEDDIESEGDSEGGDEFAFDEDEDEDGKPSDKKNKPDPSGFNRDSYYVYKDKLVQLSGTIKPKDRSKEGKVISLDFKTDEKIYCIVMDDMGKKLLTSCFQEFLVTGLVSKINEKEYTISIKTYI